MCPFQVIYEVTVVTGDVQNAGTDTLIYMSVFGANGSTEEMLLQKNKDRSNIHSSRASKQHFIFNFFFFFTFHQQVRARPGGHLQHGDR